MKNLQLSLPITYKGAPISLGVHEWHFYLGLRGNIYYFIANPRLMLTFISLLGFITIYLVFSPKEISHNQNTIVNISADKAHDVLGESLDYFEAPTEFENFKQISLSKAESYRDRFLVERQLTVTKFLIDEKVNRIDQLSDDKLLLLNKKISQLFIATILNNLDIQDHVYEFLTSEIPLKKIETALMEQAKYHIPASITLSQAALETGYGKRVINNNFFGIKDKSGKVNPIVTTEYYSKQEYKLNKHKVLTAQKIKKGGRTLYKCTVKDSFQRYSTPWQSFRAHSTYLSSNPRYAPLFANGRDFRAWADKIGSSKYGGVGYATSPVYGELLKKIISRYQLDLLDF